MIRIPQEDLTFLRVLGKGGCGEVHLAESKTLGKVAVKKTLLGGEEQIMQDFLNEADLLSKLNSPYIIRFFGTSRNQEGECIVMEYATNGTLFHFLEFLRKRKNETSFSWEKRYKMAQDITRGLLLMHSQGILHRDMKSLNILLDKDMTAKISDFGLSKIKTKSQTTTLGLYVQNNVFGSLLWKAPETFSIRNPYTDKADIYALGMIFWEIASCQVPYEGFDADTIKDSVKSGERLEIPSVCPVEFKELIELCWLQEPSQRPSATNVFEKISRIIAQIPKFDSENLISSVPQFSGSFPDPVISFQDVPEKKLNPIIIGGDSNLLTTDNQSVPIIGESEIERKIRLAQEKQQYLLMEMRKREGEKQRLLEEQEMKNKEEQERQKRAEEERAQKEKSLEEEEEKKRKEEEKRKLEEEQKKKLEEIEKENLRIEKVMMEEQERTQPPDFDNNIINAAQNGKLSSVVYLLAHGTSVNSKDSSIEFLYLIGLLFIGLLEMVILVLLNI